jgi:hypothetical protein
VACPFFFPTERCFTTAWSFPNRLPLGAGFCGTCRASGEEIVPDDATLRDSCNLGHAANCNRLPAERRADSVRFAVAEDADNRIVLAYVYDRDHAAVEHGRLAYDCAARRWVSKLTDGCVQRQAECYLAVYLERKRDAAAVR